MSKFIYINNANNHNILRNKNVQISEKLLHCYHFIIEIIYCTFSEIHLIAHCNRKYEIKTIIILWYEAFNWIPIHAIIYV